MIEVVLILNIYYEISNDLRTLKVTGNEEETTQEGVRSKGDYSRIEEAMIGEGIISIGPSSFMQCSSLISVKLPSTLKKICSGAFRNSSIRSIEIPEGVETLQSKIFYECYYLENISIPSTAIDIATTELTLGCQCISKYIVSENNPKYTSLWQNRILVEDGTVALCCCGAFSEVQIPSSIITIGPSFARYLKNLNYVTFPANSALVKISNSAFTHTSILEMHFPSKLQSVGSFIFEIVPTLTKIFIPKSLVEFTSSFLSGTKLREIILEEGSPSLKFSDGVLYDINLTMILYIIVNASDVSIGLSIETIASETLQRCRLLTRVNLDKNNNCFQEFNSAIYINNFTELLMCPGGLKNITVHEKCQIFGHRSFRETLIEEIHFAGSEFYSISTGALALCYNLRVFDVPTSLYKISNYGFTISGLKGSCLKFGNNLTILENYAWHRSNISSLDFSDCFNLTSIPSYCFAECEFLERLILPPNTVIINSFAACQSKALRAISIPNQTKNILDSAFSMCSSLSSVIFEGVPIIDRIKPLVFSECNITEIDIPDSIIGLDASSFSGNYYLSRVTFSDSSSLNSIGSGAFTNCSMIKSFRIPKNVNDIAIGALSSMSGLLDIEVDTENENYISVNHSLFSRDEKFLWCCPSGLTETTIRGKLERIEGAAFMGCSKLERIKFEGNINLKTISTESFAGCVSLKAIQIPMSVENILENAFKGCSGLSLVVFESGSRLGTIGSGSFSGCLELFSVDFEGESNLSDIADGAFRGCTKLQRFVFPNSLRSIGDSSFIGCSSLCNISLNPGLEIISGSAFSGCSAITNVTLPSSLSLLGLGAFSECKGLKHVKYCGRFNLSVNSSFIGCSENLCAETTILYEYRTVGGLIARRILDESCHMPTIVFSALAKTKHNMTVLAAIFESSQENERIM